MTSTIEAIKAKIDIGDEVGLVVGLQKAGKALKGLCPFHNERTPSFYVFPESQTWRCFGCNEGGDIFTFVQKQQGLEFREALEYLAQKANVELEEHTSGRSAEEEREASAAKERLRKLNEDALLWFHQMLLRSKEATEARTYVQSRGISSDSVIAFGLGYAPDQWDSLTRFLLSQGYSERELVEGGLARFRESSFLEARASQGIYDYFRQRIIFPIRDVRGRVIGFGGRALGDGKPKYLNSPQTLLFEKNSVLYAMDMAKDTIKQAKQVIIVEGYVDAVIAHQYGTKQTVACIGSAITEKHIQLLKKFTRQVTLALDPDAAGNAATEQGIQEAIKGFDRTIVPVPLSAGREAGKTRSGQQGGQKPHIQGMIRLEEQVDAEINVLQLPPGEDPDEVIRRDFTAWLYAVTHPLALVDYYFATKTLELNLQEPVGKTEAAKRLLPVIATISNRVKREAYLQKLSMMIGIDVPSLYEELKLVLRGQPATGIRAQFSEPAGRATSTFGEGAAGRVSSRRGQKSEQTEDEPDWVKREAQESGSAGSTGGLTSPVRGLDRRVRDGLKWEDYLIGLLLQNPGLNAHVCGIINDGDFAGTDTRELYRILNSIEQRASPPSSQQPFEQFVPSALLATVARALKCVESSVPKDGVGLVKEAIQCATRLKLAQLSQSNTELDYLIREATAIGDADALMQLLQRKQQNSMLLRTIHSGVRLQV
ncbi:MAG TPA: DNA primase [Ktedonobacteraceae bacterium]|jgi:DNA primase|nr:DNA primase [Ktedonobacteraceae bacterium]